MNKFTQSPCTPEHVANFYKDIRPMKHTAQSVHELCCTGTSYPHEIPTPQEIEDIGKREALRLLREWVASGHGDAVELWSPMFEEILGVRLEEEDHE